jgi:hypothetical protein
VTNISNTLNSFGLAKTSDTGQINPEEVAFAGSDTPSGYEIRTFTDALSASFPVVFKIEYGGGDNSGIAYWLTVGTGSDGNGNLTGVVSNRINLYSNQANANPQNYYLSGASDRLAFSMADGPNLNYTQVFGIERSKNSSGADNSDGVLLFYCNGSGSSGSSLIPFTGTWQGLQPCWPAAINYYNYSTSNSMQNGSNVGVAIPIPFNFYPFNPGLNFLIYQGTDFGAYSQETLSLYGSNHTYLAVSPYASPTIRTSDPNQDNSTGGYNTTRILMRFE